MAEAAEESGKENFLSGWSDGRNFSEADRESPATWEATEKENTAAAGSGRPVGERFQRNTESPLNICNIGLSCLERCLLLLASCSAWPGCIFQAEVLAQGKHPQRRSRLEEEFRGRWGEPSGRLQNTLQALLKLTLRRAVCESCFLPCCLTAYGIFLAFAHSFSSVE